MRLLARRPHTESELKQRLSARGYAGDGVQRAIERARAAGYLDDAELALHFVVTRAERLGHGPARLRRELVRRGVDETLARGAVERAIAAGDLDPRALLRRRVETLVGRTAGRFDRRAYGRVYNALLRAGFDADAILSELRPFRIDDDVP